MIDRPARPRRAAALVLLIAAAVAGWGLLQGRAGLATANADDYPLAFAGLTISGCCVPLLLLAARRSWRHAPPIGALQRWTFTTAVLAWFAYVAVAGPYYRGRVGCVFACWAALVALAAWRLPNERARPRRTSLLLLAIALALLGGELALRSLAAFAPSPLLTRSTASSDERLRAYAFAPGQRHFDFPANSLGCYDDEFAPPSTDRAPCVAVIGDSFSQSFVPHAFHYTTVAERELGDVQVWNVGQAAIGPAEYRVLLQQKVLPLQPDAVVVSLFLGNDFAETLPWTTVDRALADWFDRGNVLLCEVPRRLLVAARGVSAATARAQPGDLAAAQAWLHDPLREPGTFNADEFVRLEVDRARVFDGDDAERWAAFATELRALRDLAAGRPFAFVLIPDESMVEDTLWARVQQAAAAPLQRHALRERIVAWCAQQGIACLDLWPALTAVPPLADGDRHLYLRRDTHWNVRGNEVAGRAIAPFLRTLLAARGR